MTELRKNLDVLQRKRIEAEEMLESIHRLAAVKIQRPVIDFRT